MEHSHSLYVFKDLVDLGGLLLCRVIQLRVAGRSAAARYAKQSPAAYLFAFGPRLRRADHLGIDILLDILLSVDAVCANRVPSLFAERLRVADVLLTLVEIGPRHGHAEGGRAGRLRCEVQWRGVDRGRHCFNTLCD